MNKIAVLFSGGVESTSLLAHYLEKGYQVYPIFIKFGLEYEKNEIVWAKNLIYWFRKNYSNITPLHFITIPPLFKRPSKRPKQNKEIIIPLRNFILLGHCSLFMKENNITKVALGTLGNQDFPDNNVEYFRPLEKLIEKGLLSKFRILTPLLGKMKEDIIKKHKRIVPFSLTYSCVKDVKGQHCGICIKCKERIRAFQKLEINDETFYAYKEAKKGA